MALSAVALAACGLSPTARDSIKADGAGSRVAATVGGTAGGGGSAAGSVVDPAAGSISDGTGAVADGAGGVATDPGAAADPNAVVGTGSSAGGGTVAPTGGGVTGTTPTAAAVPGATATKSASTSATKAPAGTTKTTAAKGAGKTSAPAAKKPGTGTPTKTGPGTGTTATGGGAAAGAACGVAADATGITADTINIGLHAPQTGTGAPLPPSFAAGSNLYFDNHAHQVCGKDVKIDFQDDQYTASHATGVCEDMAKRDFLVIGAAGTNQIQACASDRALNAANVPYLSGGVTTNGLTSLPNYFALSLTYAQQGALVVANAQKDKLGAGKWHVVVANGGNFDDAFAGITAALDAAKVPYDTERVDQDNPNTIQANGGNTGTKIATGGYSTSFFDTSPGYFLYATAAAYKAGYSGYWTGPGTTMTEVTVAQLVCTSSQNLISGKAEFLSPYTGIDRATDDFKAAAGGKYDDIEWSLWGVSQLLHQALTNMSKGALGRANFLSTLNGVTLPGGAYHPVNFAGGTHFGGTAAYALRLNCSETEPNGQNMAGQWDTVGEVSK